MLHTASMPSQVMAKHTKENVDGLIARLKVALMAAQGSYQAYRLLVSETAAESEPEQARRSA